MGEHLVEHGRASSCNHLMVATVSEKYIWQLKFQQKLHVGAQQILKKEKKILKNEVIQDVIYNMKGFDTNILVHFK